MMTPEHVKVWLGIFAVVVGGVMGSVSYLDHKLSGYTSQKEHVSDIRRIDEKLDLIIDLLRDGRGRTGSRL
jgi:hypothetical protein